MTDTPKTLLKPFESVDINDGPFTLQPDTEGRHCIAVFGPGARKINLIKDGNIHDTIDKKKPADDVVIMEFAAKGYATYDIELIQKDGLKSHLIFWPHKTRSREDLK